MNGRRRRASTFRGIVLVFGNESRPLVSGLRTNGFEVLSARREDEVTALAEELPLDAVIIDHGDPTETYSALLTVTMCRPGCKRVLISDDEPPASMAEYVDARLPRESGIVDLVWLLVV